MRDAFHEQLDSITTQLVDMTRLAGSAMARATTAPVSYTHLTLPTSDLV